MGVTTHTEELLGQVHFVRGSNDSDAVIKAPGVPGIG